MGKICDFFIDELERCSIIRSCTLIVTCRLAQLRIKEKGLKHTKNKTNFLQYKYSNNIFGDFLCDFFWMGEGKEETFDLDTLFLKVFVHILITILT